MYEHEALQLQKSCYPLPVCYHLLPGFMSFPGCVKLRQQISHCSNSTVTAVILSFAKKFVFCLFHTELHSALSKSLVQSASHYCRISPAIVNQDRSCCSLFSLLHCCKPKGSSQALLSFWTVNFI